MAIKKIITKSNPKLGSANSLIEDFCTKVTKVLIQDLIDTMHDADLIGLAAPQIGVNYQIFVTEPRATKMRTKEQTDQLRVYINPLIITESETRSTIYEGCGSVEDIFGPVVRAKEVTVEAYNENGERCRLRADGLLARVIFHEMDHLSGITFDEKVTEKESIVDRETYLKEIKNSIQQISASRISVIDHEILPILE